MDNIGKQNSDLEDKGFLSLPNEEETEEREFSREEMQMGFLSKRDALDGGEQVDAPIPRDHLSAENDEVVLAEIEEIPDYVEEVADMMLPVLQISISRGIVGGWDSKAKMPTKDFIEVEGADLEKAVKNAEESSIKRKLQRKEECMVYELIKKDISSQTEQERIIRDALIKRASRYCPN